MTNDEQLRDKIRKAIWDDASDRDVSEILALIHEERREAEAEANFDRDAFELEKKQFRANVRAIDMQMEIAHATLGTAMDELETIEYRTMKDKTLLKSDILREYFRVMKGILPPAA